MLRIITLLALICGGLHATDKVQTVVVTIPVEHTWDEGGVKMAKIPFTGWDLDNPYYTCSLYSVPKIVFENKAHLKQNINLISAYRISVDSDLKDGITTITVRTDKAEKPKGHKRTVEEVAEWAVKAIREDYPDQDKYKVLVSNKPFAPK